MNKEDKLKMLIDLENTIGLEYFELLQIASIINILANEINNKALRKKADEFVEFCKKEADRILSEDNNEEGNGQ